MSDEHTQTAAEVLADYRAGPGSITDHLAAALAAAEQRGRDETARKVRALADEWERWQDEETPLTTHAFRSAAAAIRRALADR